MKILVIHGPNLQLLGQREPEIYGCLTIEEINSVLKKEAKKADVELTIVQSNHEGEIAELIGSAFDSNFKAIVINPAAYTHTSVAIRDAVSASGIPVVEVHLSNIFAREEFRKISLITPVAAGIISGFGIDSYLMGLTAAIKIAQEE